MLPELNLHVLRLAGLHCCARKLCRCLGMRHMDLCQEIHQGVLPAKPTIHGKLNSCALLQSILGHIMIYFADKQCATLHDLLCLSPLVFVVS
eukprot:772939-Pelagomonas_calceolata.AAC.2